MKEAWRYDTERVPVSALSSRFTFDNDQLALTELDVSIPENGRARGSGTIKLGQTRSGTFANTLTSDNAYETITEVLINVISQLEHRWTINVPPGSSRELHIEGFRSTSGDGDEFKFEISIDGGANWVEVLVSQVPFADDGVDIIQSYPSTFTGDVLLRVRDSSRAPGAQTLDSISIDRIWIRTITP